jgi:Zn-finger nucleic acid-binding protein
MATAHRFCENLEEGARLLVQSASSHAAYPVDTAGTVACPVCGNALARTRLQQAAVDIDFCGYHGTWFDKDELARIAQSAAVARAYGQRARTAQAVQAAHPPTRAAKAEAADVAGAADTALFGLEIVVAVLEIFGD